MRHGRKEAVGIEGDAVDPVFHKKGRELGVVARSLPADAHLDARGASFGDRLRDHLLHRFVAFVEHARQEIGIAVHPENQLREVIQADRKAVEPPDEFSREELRLN